MTTTSTQVLKIEMALRRRAWLPSEAERRVGASVLRRRRSLMGHLDSEAVTGRTTAEMLRLQQDLADQITGNVLPEARALLGDSPMVELLEAYAAALHAMAPYAQKMRPLLEAGGEDLTEYSVLTPEERDAMQHAWKPIIAAGSVLGAALTGDVD